MFTRITFLVLFAISCAVSLCRANGELWVKPTEEVNIQEDRKRLAESAIAEGKQFEWQGNAEAFRRALDRYEKALALLQSLNDRPSAAAALGHIGTVHHLLGEKQKALDAFQQQLQLWRAEKERNKEIAAALHNIGIVYSSMGMAPKAIEFYEEALPLRRAAADRAALASTLDNLGLAYLHAGEMQKASDYSDQALTLFRERGQWPRRRGQGNGSLDFRTIELEY